MHALLVTPSLAPFGGRDSAANLCSTLPKALRRIEHNATVLSPLYKTVDPRKHSLARRLTKLEFELGGRSWTCELYTGRNPAGTELIFIGNEELFLSVSSFDEGQGAIHAQRLGVFSEAVVQFIAQADAKYDVVHAHDWVGAAVVAKLRARAPAIPIVLTVHDAAEQGRFSKADAATLGLGEEAVDDGGINALKAGLLLADRVTTLSPNYALHLQEPGAANGLETTFRHVRDQLFGIRNGIDPSIWNPITDPAIPARFDPTDLSGKSKCKAALQNELMLAVRGEVPLVGAVGRTEGDGMDLLAKVGPDLLRNDVQLVVQLDGGGELVAIFEELWDRWPDRISIRTGHDEAFRHLLIASSDLLIVPGRQAPTQNIQMCAQRYGALPVVHRSGGLADEVVDCEASLKTGSGFLYDEPTDESLLAALQRGVAAYSNVKAFRDLQGRVMRIDHSWERSARQYEALYRELLQA